MSANGLFLRNAGVLIIFYFLNSSAFAQKVQVRAGFLADSMKIGEQTGYYLAAAHPKNTTVLFPDSTHAFAPFEFEEKQYFPTRTATGISIDSAVYYLTTFEVQRVQKLSLPVYVVQARDCTVVASPVDSVLITQLVAHVPDSVSAANLPLRVNTAYEKVHYSWNFWLIVIMVSILVVAAVAVWLIFGKKIKRYFRARRLQKNHRAFLDRYNSLLAELKTAYSAFTTESALAAWKKYMEQLESRPYTKWTTRETVILIREPALREDLGMIDKAIYGHDTTVIPPLENLKNFADQKFRKKIKEVEHGQ